MNPGRRKISSLILAESELCSHSQIWSRWCSSQFYSLFLCTSSGIELVSRGRVRITPAKRASITGKEYCSVLVRQDISLCCHPKRSKRGLFWETTSGCAVTKIRQNRSRSRRLLSDLMIQIGMSGVSKIVARKGASVGIALTWVL